MTPLEEIRRLYFAATRGSIHRDLKRAIDLLKAMKDDDERAKAAVYMDGLSQMRSEWSGGGGGPRRPNAASAAGKNRRSRG
ncbi:MAG TPA: hypothetical protein VFO19_04960 [Vicinamibacterales bacterium]|nr:hypothetical protein [Vicinamibacterales bacterium]